MLQMPAEAVEGNAINHDRNQKQEAYPIAHAVQTHAS